MNTKYNKAFTVMYGLLAFTAICALTVVFHLTYNPTRTVIKTEVVRESPIDGSQSAGELNARFGKPSGEPIAGADLNPQLDGLTCYPYSDNQSYVVFRCVTQAA